MTTLEDLHMLNPVPELRLTSEEEQRRGQLLSAILQLNPNVSTASPTPAPARRRNVRLGVIAGAAGVLAFGALGVGGVTIIPEAGHLLFPSTSDSVAAPNHEGFSAVTLASWTAVPTHPSAASPEVAAAARGCAASMDEPDVGKDAAYTITNVEQRGAVMTFILNRSGWRALCFKSTDGGTGGWELIDGPANALPAVDAASASLQSAGTSGAGATAFSYAWGQVGTDVHDVTLSVGGRAMTATVENGVWSAWWVPRDGQVDPGSGTISWTTTAGAHHSVPFAGVIATN